MAYTKDSDAELLQAALYGYEHERALLEEHIAEIRRELGDRAGRSDGDGTTKPKRLMSAAARRRISAAQRKRWAEAKKTAGAAPVKMTGAKTKRKMNAAERKRIAEATRKRWKAYRARKTAAAR